MASVATSHTLIQYRLFDRNHGPAPNDIPHWPQPVNLQALADNRTPISQNVFPPSNAVLPTHLTPADRASLSQNAVRTTASTPQTKKAPAGVIDIRPSAPLPKAKPEPTTTTPTPQIHPRQMHYDRIILALQQKQYDKAEASLHNAYQRLEQDNGLDLLRAQMLYQQNQPRQALQLMQTLSAPQHADMQQRYLWLMARLHNTTGNTELALKILKRGLRVWPHSPALWLEMANLLEQSQEVEAARSAYTFLLTLQPLPAEIKTTAEQHLQRLSR